MKKRLPAALLVLALCLSLAGAAWAAPLYGDKTYPGDAAVSSTQAAPLRFNHMTVCAGASVTLTDGSYLEIYDALTVEPGGSLAGGQIWFFRQYPATVSGLPLWYETGGDEDLPFPDACTLDDLWALTDGPVLVLRCKPATGHYVVAEATHALTFQSELFSGGGKNEGDRTVSSDARVFWPVTYDALTVRAGAALELIPETGVTVNRSLTVEPSASVRGGRLTLARGASVSGLALYYETGAGVRPLEGGPDALWTVMDNWDFAPFAYDAASGRYIVRLGDGPDPFVQPGPADGGPTQPDPNAERELAIARQLRQLGLFRGVVSDPVTAEDFALLRAPTRTEAVVLLIRLLGRDAEAKDYPKNYPHDDVADWAKGYITYAFDEGITNGVGSGVFGEGNATVRQFLTFVLRAMGYEDESKGGADFSWRRPEELADTLGIVLSPNDMEHFTRGVCVRIMEIALRNACKGGGRLCERLAEEGVFTMENYHAVMGD